MNPVENRNSSRKYKRYDEAFKRQAVEHWILSGKSARQIALALGINRQSLQNWKRQFQPLPAGLAAGTLKALQAENQQLEKELRRVTQLLTQPQPSNEPVEGLSSQEQKILNLLSKGYAYKEIADNLSISVNTVRMFIQRIYKKMRVHSRAELMMRFTK